MTHAIRHHIRAAQGVVHALCSEECGQRWLTATMMTDQDAELRAEPLRPTASCAHCAWCGYRVHYEPRCRIHEGGCMIFDWRVTELGRRAVQLLLQRSGLTELPPRAYGYLSHVAWVAAEAGSWRLSGLVEGTWALRVDWLPS